MKSNMAVTLDAMGRKDEAMRLRAETAEELSRQLGEDHPMSRIARDERRFERELEPMAV
ncbi:hypothetical protein [Streptomyces sp. NPDC058240]|uniref:hypothetical protein n=1 Tax=Streptomyces sp. NPDC058240 TaxID=3346396 RepID=UPI0036EE4581